MYINPAPMPIAPSVGRIPLAIIVFASSDVDTHLFPVPATG
jgi:hypothetical protein